MIVGVIFRLFKDRYLHISSFVHGRYLHPAHYVTYITARFQILKTDPFPHPEGERTNGSDTILAIYLK